MKRVVVILCLVVVLMCPIANRATAKEISVTLHCGELVYDESHTAYTFSIAPYEEWMSLPYCWIVYQLRANEKGKQFICNLTVNGKRQGGGGGSGGRWGTLTSSGTTAGLFSFGDNTITLERETGEGGAVPYTDHGFIRGVGIVFSDRPRDWAMPAKDFSDEETGSGQWFLAWIHDHGPFGDGLTTVAEYGKIVPPYVSIVFLTEHWNMIEQKTKPTAKFRKLRALKAEECIGFDNYIRECQRATIPGKLLVLPGAEIGATRLVGKKKVTSHTLALGTVIKDSEIDRLVEKDGAQPKIIDRLNKLGWVPIAAHPSFVLKGPNPLPWELTNYSYDKRPDQCLGLCGVEFFNNAKDDQFGDDLNFLLSFLKRGVYASAIAGQDPHTRLDPEFKKRTAMVTGIFAKDLTPDSVVEAIRMGRTYATDSSVFILESNVLPGVIATKTSIPEIYIRFSSQALDDKEIYLYRDGELVEDMVDVGVHDGIFRYIDYNAPKGSHTYLVANWDKLVISPFVFDVE